MAQLSRIVSALKKEERHLANQLAKIRTAIASLEFGGFGVPKAAVIDTPNAVRDGSKRRGRTMSAAARKAVSQRMKKYWAAKRKARKA